MTAACWLAKHDVLVDVHEVDSFMDGLAKTIQPRNQKVDLEPHRFFSSDPLINTVWLEIAGTYLINKTGLQPRLSARRFPCWTGREMGSDPPE